MKRKTIIGAVATVAICLCLCVTAYAGSVFPDVDDSAEYAEAVEYVYNAGIMLGDENGHFNPNKTINRAEMATVVCRMMKEAESAVPSSVFSDVPIDFWGNAYIAKAAELGIVNGIGDGKYAPLDNVTFEQAATMIVRAVGGEKEAENRGGYPDGYLSVAEEYGFLENIFSEEGDPLSRADVAIIVYNSGGFHFESEGDHIQDGSQID